MGRPRRFFKPGTTYHIMNRYIPELSVETKKLINIQEIIERANRKFQVNIISHNILKNHFHLVVHFPETSSATISSVMQWIGTLVAKTVNQILGRHGSVFHSRFKSKVKDTITKIRNAVRYVIHNAAKHYRMHPADWPYSSYHYYMDGVLKKKDKITKHVEFILKLINHKARLTDTQPNRSGT